MREAQVSVLLVMQDDQGPCAASAKVLRACLVVVSCVQLTSAASAAKAASRSSRSRSSSPTKSSGAIICSASSSCVCVFVSQAEQAAAWALACAWWLGVVAMLCGHTRRCCTLCDDHPNKLQLPSLLHDHHNGVAVLGCCCCCCCSLTVSGAALLTSPAPVVLSLFAGPWSIFWSVSALSADARAACLLSGASVTSLTSCGWLGGAGGRQQQHTSTKQPASGCSRAGCNHNGSIIKQTGDAPAAM